MRTGRRRRLTLKMMASSSGVGDLATFQNRLGKGISLIGQFAQAFDGVVPDCRRRVFECHLADFPIHEPIKHLSDFVE